MQAYIFSERYFSYQCLDNKIDPQLIINQFEIDTYAFAEMSYRQSFMILRILDIVMKRLKTRKNIFKFLIHL